MTQRTHVESGLDVLLSDEERLRRLRGARVGLLANPTTVDRNLDHAIDALRDRSVDIVRLFGPEHGVRAEAQDMESVEQSTDPITGIPVVSLYGSTFDSLKPTSDDLAGLDLVIADIQDIGARYYTYAYTVGLMMEACGEAGVSVWVLDRPNPINGVQVEGNVVQDDCRSFVGMQPLANRHGMTMGELAHFFARFGGWRCDFEVVEMRGWRRELWFDEIDLPWVMPSPNMPTLDTATVYPGQCLLEGTNCSEGRGTTRPFELFGAPYVDAVALEARLDACELPGVAFRLTTFRPMFQKHAGEICHGLQMHVTDRSTFDSTTTSYAVVGALYELFDGFAWREQAYEFVDDQPAIDLLFGDQSVREGIEAGADPLELARQTECERSDFLERRRECLIYE
jgi:uncharacterized protein YbbC (DUF1343 family)